MRTEPYWASADQRVSLYHGHVLDVLRDLPAESVQCVVTSPPYWGLRSYGTEPEIWGGDAECQHEWTIDSYQRRSADNGTTEKQLSNFGANRRDDPIIHAFCARCHAWRGSLGMEPTPEMYVEHMTEIFREVRRVLRKDGTVWCNLGDSYAGSGKGLGSDHGKSVVDDAGYGEKIALSPGLKPKDLVGIPWRVAFALQADGWWLRSDIIWAKPNPMPESVTDRPTRSHEYVFLLTKSSTYYYDADAIRETSTEPAKKCGKNSRRNVDRDVAHNGRKQDAIANRRYVGFNDRYDFEHPDTTRNKRSVWTIATEPYPEAHFATFPTALVKPCVLAGCPEDGVVLDPFAGSGTALMSAYHLGRKAIGIDLNAEYLELAANRLRQSVLPLEAR